MTLPVIAHPDLTHFIRTYSESDLGEGVWKCIHKLKQQQFDSGLRVKKLKGIGKKVWEARVTRAVRLIFTYTQSIEPETKEAKTYIAIQDICLDHDDVSRQVKARKRTPDATWLDAEEIEVIGSLETDRASLTPEEQSAIKEAEAEDLQIPEEVVDELVGNIQWQVVESESQWQEAITQQDADLPLKLTPEEYELVNYYGNLLLSGNAGTGKTTVGVYRLIKSLETLPEGKRLYVAYNPILVKEAYQHFRRLVGSQITAIESLFEFKTIRDLCLDVLEEAGETYLEADEVNYERFNQFYLRSERKKYPPTLVWDEIRSIIKGSCLETDQTLLSKNQYQKLGKRRSSVIPKQDRDLLYQLADWYRKKLDQEDRFDEIDLARKVIQYIKQGKGNKYQLIICDEVQDLTELQLHLLMQLLSPNGQIFFAGDLNQMISPSGFRWEELKTKFFKGNRQAEQKTLHFNFRSVGSLTQLANQVLKLKSRLLNEKNNESNQTVSSYGEWARLINAPLSNLQPTLEQLYPEDAILVRTEADKEKLSTEFQSSFVFTIEEAKGLEFDTVFLGEFFQPYSSLWQKAFKGKPTLKDKEIPQLRLELNLLYVAITRARRILNIWENQISNIWTQEEVQSFTQQVSPESVREVRVEPTAEMWKERGLYYLEAKFYRQALECFNFSGDTKLQRHTEAKLLLQEGKEHEAIEIFLELEEHEQVAQLFEKQKQWEKAAEQYDLAGISQKAARSRERISEDDFIKVLINKREDKPLKNEQATQFNINDLNVYYAPNGSDFLFYYERGNKYYHQGNLKYAIDDFNQAIKLNSYFDLAYNDRGLARQKKGDLAGAIDDFNQAISIDTDYAIAYNNRGHAHCETGDLESAIADYNEAIRLKPDDPDFYHNRGVALFEKGSFAKAIENFTEVIHLDSNYADGYYHRGMARFQKGDVSGTMKDLNKAAKLYKKQGHFEYYKEASKVINHLKQ